jgi:L-ascorbate metabolism protein UlaG (beta-lactamase superfamily)
MNATDAAKAASFINCKQIIGMHYDTFGYIKINHEEAIAEFESKGLALALMNIGESKIF